MNEPELSDPYYTVDEVAIMLKVTRATIYKWMNQGDLAYVQLGGVRRIDRNELVRFIDERRKRMPSEIQVPILAVTPEPGC